MCNLEVIQNLNKFRTGKGALNFQRYMVRPKGCNIYNFNKNSYKFCREILSPAECDMPSYIINTVIQFSVVVLSVFKRCHMPITT